MAKSRIEQAAARLGIKLGDAKQLKLPSLTKEQVTRLEDLYPIRLIYPNEDVRAYERYCGAAELVKDLKDHCQEVTTSTSAVGDSDEDLDGEAVGRAIAAHNGTAYNED